MKSDFFFVYTIFFQIRLLAATKSHLVITCCKHAAMNMVQEVHDFL